MIDKEHKRTDEDLDDALFEEIFRAADKRRLERIAQEIKEAGEIPEHVFSEKYYADNAWFLQPESKKKSNRLPWERIAATIGLLLGGILILSLSVEASRMQIITALREFGEGYLKLNYSDYTESKPSLSNDLENSIWLVEDIVEPSYIVPGYRKEERTSRGTFFYVHDNGKIIILNIRKVTATSPAYDNDDYLVEEIAINDSMGFSFTSLIDSKMNMLVWQTEGTLIELSGYEDIGELLKMAKSIRER